MFKFIAQAPSSPWINWLQVKEAIAATQKSSKEGKVFPEGWMNTNWTEDEMNI